jgi:hypothetical protein
MTNFFFFFPPVLAFWIHYCMLDLDKHPTSKRSCQNTQL